MNATTVTAPTGPGEPVTEPVTIALSVQGLVTLLASVLPLACTDPTVPTVGAVLLQRDGHYLSAAATDRYVMGIRRVHRLPDDAMPEAFRFLLRAADAKDLLAALSKGLRARSGRGRDRRTRVEALYDGHTLAFADLDGAYPDQLPHGGYPDLRAMLREGLNRPPATHDPWGLAPALVAKFDAAVNTETTTAVRLQRHAGHFCALTCGPDFIGVVMETRYPGDSPAPGHGWHL